MDISPELAQIIVLNMKEIINKEINYINREGMIIASTDLKRIGVFHGGAKKVVTTGKELTIHHEKEFKGAIQGVNFPIIFEGEIIGVIGITGEEKEVGKYGEIIKKMTEILIKEEYVKNIRYQTKANHRMLIEELLRYQAGKNELYIDQEKSILFLLKKEIPRIVIVSKVRNENGELINIQEDIFNIFFKVVQKEEDNLVMQNSYNVIMIIRKISDSYISNIIQEINEEIYKTFSLKSYFGVGSVEFNLSKIKESYKKSIIALESSLKSESIVKHYKELDIELITNNISGSVVHDFKHKIIGGLEPEDVLEYGEIIELFEKYNGSINRISDSLFIHKNTLQYKIKQLKEKTGYDLRKYKDFVLLKLAFEIQQNE